MWGTSAVACFMVESSTGGSAGKPSIESGESSVISTVRQREVRSGQEIREGAHIQRCSRASLDMRERNSSTKVGDDFEGDGPGAEAIISEGGWMPLLAIVVDSPTLLVETVITGRTRCHALDWRHGGERPGTTRHIYLLQSTPKANLLNKGIIPLSSG